MKVEIVRSEGRYELLRGGAPYRIRGVGMTSGDLAAFAAHGGNSIRNWTTDDLDVATGALLDEAHANGVTVALCLPMGSERHGFDYDDAEAVAGQLEAMRVEVLKYRDHPALLFWIIGNELNHGYSNPRVYDAVNDVARMINELDPDHPKTTAISGFRDDVIAEIRNRAPALDFISFQLYGSLFGLPERIKALGFEDPFMVTEWGTLGYWEIEQTDWGAPIELTSTQKAGVYKRGYTEILEPLEGQLIGSYAFYWGQKQERTPTWFGLLTDRGEQTESIDVLHYMWSGRWPADRSPQLLDLRLNGKVALDNVRIESGGRYFAQVDAVDPDGDPLAYRWELKPESTATQSGGDFEPQIQNIEGFISGDTDAKVEITAPPPGAYRLFVYVIDGQGNAAHANLPFLSVPGH
ncbi:MAG: glycoside hydrolase family 2 TIM barrel-domain containing protein [Wenzhouxiangella sp.]